MPNRKAHNGHVAHMSGLAAEDIVARDYQRRGYQDMRKRFRGQAGEIDLIAKQGDEVVFVEVKKSNNFASAALKLGQRQIERIYQTAAEYLANEPRGQLTPVRFDVALVGSTGAIEIIENAFGHA